MQCVDRATLGIVMLPHLSSETVVFATVLDTCRGMCILRGFNDTLRFLLRDNTILDYVPFGGTTCLGAVEARDFVRLGLLVGWPVARAAIRLVSVLAYWASKTSCLLPAVASISIVPV